LLHLGIPYDQAVNIPLDLAYAFLIDERPDNTHQRQSKKSNVNPAQSNAIPQSSETTTFVAARRKHSKKV